MTRPTPDVPRFPIADCTWAPERTLLYQQLVEKLNAFMESKGPEPTPSELHAWSWVASRDAEYMWNDWYARHQASKSNA